MMFMPNMVLRVCFILLIFALSFNVSVAAADPPAKETYYVVAGDNLYNIGIKYGVSHGDLMSANELDSTTIRPGQTLIIPTGRTGPGQASRGNNNRGEADLLARLIQAEAASEPYPAKVAVGAVVLNRVNSSLFPNSIRLVINQVTNGTYQFTPVLNGSINRAAGAEAVQAAQEALSGADPTEGALFFFSTGVTDKHLQSRPVSMVVGKLTFAL
ncbi:MAG TPA: hypothetical protein DEF34_13415 [Desulfotomaculum sp.]|nr:hypothetical protein [Desulfotomaculum sp.]